jgi:hypothetical protein
VLADPNRAIEQLLGALDGWAQPHPVLVDMGASSTRPQHAELVQQCLALLHLKPSDRPSRMVHQEAPDEVILITETSRRHIVGREEKSRILNGTRANDDC